jgi:hypothetical protein
LNAALNAEGVASDALPQRGPAPTVAATAYKPDRVVDSLGKLTNATLSA